MNIDIDSVRELVGRPSESLNVEIKRWLDPDTPVGKSKIVRAALALRNRNGGYLLIGFDDQTLRPDEKPSVDPRITFKLDRIQALISKHASDLFEVAVEFIERDGCYYPVIVIPAGVRTPVAIRLPVMKDAKNELVKVGEVPFRTLSANGTVSTAAARPGDWAAILEICFENREAEIGRFLRRHLSDKRISEFAAALGIQSGRAPLSPSLQERTDGVLKRGEIRFNRVMQEHGMSAEEQRMATAGGWHVALMIDPPVIGRVADQRFYATLAASNPRFSGWPVWLDTSGFTDQWARPKQKDRGWESLIIGPSFWDHFEFSRFEPAGEFYQRRLHDDDASASARKATIGVAFDPGLVVSNVAEAIAVGLAFAKALGCPADATTLGFAFRWDGLLNRSIVPWSSQFRITPGQYKALTEAVESFAAVPVDTAETGLAPFVHTATSELFAAFNGFSLPPNLIEDRIRQLLERRG